MPAQVKIDQQQVRFALGGLRAAVSDREKILAICGEIMRTSVARTFREEGSPAGSWPQLSPSTLKNKRYSAGHRLLILTGRLFNSISYTVSGNTLTIGTDVVYAGVHQYGSRDYAPGPRTLQQSRATIGIGAYFTHRMKELPAPGMREIRDSRGRVRGQRTAYQGPRNRKTHEVRAHDRHQNIPPRPFLVFRPEDPGLMTRGIERYFAAAAGGNTKGVIA